MRRGVRAAVQSEAELAAWRRAGRHAGLQLNSGLPLVIENNKVLAAMKTRLDGGEGRAECGSVMDPVAGNKKQMKRVIDTSEVLGTVAVPEGTCELFAAADAGFDEAAGQLVVKLEAFLRPAGFLAKERHFRANWLPANETVTESVAREESGEVAREIFHRWVRRVRESAPSLHHV